MKGAILQRFSSSLSSWLSVSSSMVGILAAVRARSACHLR